MADSESKPALSIERSISVEFIKASGGFAVKALKNQKEPARGWDPRMNNPAKSAQLLTEIAFTDDNIGVHLHGALVDVDVDGENAGAYLVPALDALLPECSHVWGRASRLRTHRAYLLKFEGQFDPAAYPVLARIKRIKEVKVEIRGGPSSRGEYSLMPGSTHPSGERYEWADIARARSTPSVTTPEALLRGIRMAGAVAVLAPHWIEGMRQDLTQCLSGFLHRAHAIGQALGDDLFSLSKEESLTLLNTILDVTGDDPSDRRARRLAFEKTWTKADKNVPVVGATRLKELVGDESIVSKLYTLLTDNPDVAAIDEFTSRFAIWKGPALAIDLELASKGHPRPYMSRPNFASSYGDKFVTIGDKRRLLPEMLWALSSATRVYGMTFDPSGGQLVEDHEGMKVNQWSGFHVQPYPTEVEDADVKPFIDYVREVVASGNEEVYHWVMAWAADIVQHPAEKCGTSLALVGQEGAGKSVLGHAILGGIIGKAHYASTNSVDKIVRDFNAGFVNKVLIQADEATNSRQRSTAARLKSFITDPDITVEPKGVDSFQVPNHARLLFTSNDKDDAIYLNSGNEDRRYTVIEVSNHRVADVETYWYPFFDWLAEPDTLAKIHRWLADFPYTKRLIQRPLSTAAKRRMQQSSWDPFDGWLASMVSRNHPLSARVHREPYQAFEEYDAKVVNRNDWPKWVHMTAMLEDYKAYVRANNLRDATNLTESHIRMKLIKLGLVSDSTSIRVSFEQFDDRTGIKTTVRPRVYNAPDFGATCAYLERKHGFTVDQEPPTMQAPPMGAREPDVDF